MRKAYSYIRMSTETQLKGDSLRRQLEASEAYAKTNNLELVDEIDGTTLKDIGVSAFNGNNTQNGVLAVFLAALQAKKIPQNSVLLVESLDRLSRDRLAEALNQFLLILTSGIEIVTLSDNQRYTKEIVSSSPSALFIGLSVMFRANEESEIKSRRLRASWENKRTKASTKIITRACPAWIKYNETTQKFDLIEDRAKVVRLIFDLCINTCGIYGIARYLNERDFPVFGDATLWHRSYIRKILTSKTVIGELQTFTTKEGKREKTGDPILDYYPKCVDDNTYHLANAAIQRRNVTDRGRKGKSFSNIFSGFTYCGSCGFKMILRNRGDTPKGGKTLCCSNNLQGGGCKMGEWKLGDLENSLFSHFREINFDELIDNIEDKKLSLLSESEILQTKLKNKTDDADRATSYLVGSDLPDASKKRIFDQLNSLEAEILTLKSQIENVEKQLIEENDARKALGSTELKELIEKIQDHHDDYMFRSSVNQLLSRQIENIQLIEQDVAYMPWEYDDDSEEIKAFRQISSKAKTLAEIVITKDFAKFCKKYQRTIKIKYKTGAIRNVMLGAGISMRANQQTKRGIA